MSVITMNATVAASCGAFVIGQNTYEIEDVSDSTGASSSRILGPARWTLSMAGMTVLDPSQSAEWEMLMFKMRGSVNRLTVWDVSRPAPRGDMRGSLTLSSLAALGAESLVVTGGAPQAGKTLKMGDWLQVGTGLGTSQLVKVSADATANGSGVITVSIEPPIRIAFSASTAVAWDKPVAYYKSARRSLSYAAEAGSLNYSGHSLDLIEQWN